MYPNALFWNIDLYTICLGIGFFAAAVLFRILADRAKLAAKVQNLCLAAGVIAMVTGYFIAVLFQGVYNALATGSFSLSQTTGATFYGGLIGGIAVFTGVYFLAGRWIFKQKGEATRNFSRVANIAAACIAIAHGFGRIGCLFAGCCHGAVTSAWYGIWNAELGAKTVPTQLFEALFLFALCGLLSFLELRSKKRRNLSLYFILYGVWRFGIEFLRADDRGKTFIPGLSPSQLTAILFVLAGILLLVFAQKGKREET